MAGILRLSNTGTGNGQSTITTAATGDATYTLPSFGGTLLTSSGNVTLPFASGTVSAPSVTFISDLDTGLYSPGANQVAIATSGISRLLVDSSGRVGIGITSPSTLVHCIGGASGVDSRLTIGNNGAAVQTGVDGSNFAFIGTNQNQPFYFFTNGTERARIDTSGRLLVGTSSVRDVGYHTPRILLDGADFAAATLAIVGNEANANGSYLVMGKSRSGSVGGTTIVQSGDVLGQIRFAGADGSDLNQTGASITCEVDGTPGANDMPGRLVFSTTADGASSPTERFRISQNGVVTVKNGAVAEIGTLADGATITPDLAANCNFTVTISGNRTLANPSNITAGQTGSIFIIQGTGSNALSWGSYWDFPGGSAPTLTTTSGAVDRVDYVVRSSTSIHTVFTANYS